MRFICQSILDGIQFLMKLYFDDEIEEIENKFYSKVSKSQVEWVEEESYFLNYLNGRIDY